MIPPRHDSPTLRRSQRVLQMVHELHKAGYQRLRIVPGMSRSGIYWRCGITQKSNTLKSHGAKASNYDQVAHYSSAMENRYFEWEDAATDTARQLAEKFLERFPQIATLGAGSDWEYAGWFVEMLGFAELGSFPVAYADWYGEPPSYLAQFDERELPVPPPGDAEP